MGSIDRYIFRTTLGAFLIILVSLTAVIWVTHALRDIDLMTNQGQTILVFVGITGLVIPQLVLIIAPIALVIAVAHVLNKLATDSEIIVMNAAGMSPWFLFRPFFTVSVVVSLLIAALTAYISPRCLRELRSWATEVRADLVTNIVQPGRFTTIEHGLTFHIRERRPNGQLLGIFVDDRRDPSEHATFLAEQGEIVKNPNGTFLVLENGSVQRSEMGQRDPTIVVFDRYAFDLSRLSEGVQTLNLSVHERYFWQLFNPDPNDPEYKKEPGQFRAELHDRIMAPLYPLAFIVIAYAYLGAPRTTRQSRSLSIVSTIAGVAALRLIGFASMVFAIYSPLAVSFQYVAVAGACALGLTAISRGMIIEPPAFITNTVARITERLSRRLATT
jgi:lipopolysaccharide export system permease protein